MPSLPSKTSRRKHVTPIANLHENDVWQRTFKLLGLMPLIPFSSIFNSSTMAPPDDISAPSEDGALSKKRRVSILDLPSEIQKDIFKHSSSTDLIALSLVSKHFRDIAAAQLYRNFHIVFPDEDDPSYESPIDGLAGGLDTLVTSEYNYARFLKEIVLDTLSGGTKGERAYRHYTYDLSCGKFMNTLFLLALRKAQALEKFKWDLRVEISRPVFKALHQILALEHLHVRMHSGASLYEPPPPLPSLEDSKGPITLQMPNSSSTSSWIASSMNSYACAKNASKSKGKKESVTPLGKEPPTFSGFKNLKTLSVLDMDTLEYINEIKSCLIASSSTLNKLKLSFSENLARQARKPPPAEDPGDESDQEVDEFGNMIPPPPPPPMPSSSDDAAAPAKSFRALEEKKAQEAVLSRIFGVETLNLRKTEGGSETPSDEEEKVDDEKNSPGTTFIKDLTSVCKRLITATNGAGSKAQQKETLEIIEKAARRYVDATEAEMAKLEKLEKKGMDEIASVSSSAVKPTPESSSGSITGKADEEITESKQKETAMGESSSLFNEEKKERKLKEIVGEGPNPDDIDVYQPEATVDPKEFDDVPASNPQNEDTADIIEGFERTDKIANALVTSPRGIDTKRYFERLGGLEKELARCIDETNRISKLVNELQQTQDVGSGTTSTPTDTDYTTLARELLSQQTELKTDIRNVREHIDVLGLEVADLHQSGSKSPKNQESKMSEYIRTTRGLALQSLAIYLIPIKASVLSKAIDFTVLERITLLNVGAQAPFWNLLARENKMSPLPLQKIHTDNVTPQFLTFASQLDILTELFLLERNAKVPEYSFAPKTSVSIEQIRKRVLRKHMSTLRRLMIKNENDNTWDISESATKLICKRGKLLEELAVSFGIKSVHIFNQYLPGLVNLRAMHIITFRNEDTCHWVIREVRKFAVDSVSHSPEMKLEYLALESTVERLVRRIRQPKAKDKGKTVDKGEGKVKESEVPGVTSYPNIMEMIKPAEEDSSSGYESGGGESEDESVPNLKLETLEGVRFYDIFGVRIFRKDVMMGRL